MRRRGGVRLFVVVLIDHQSGWDCAWCRDLPVFVARGPQSTNFLDSWAPSWMAAPRPHVYYGDAVDLSAYYGRPINRRLLVGRQKYGRRQLSTARHAARRARALFVAGKLSPGIGEG